MIRGLAFADWGGGCNKWRLGAGLCRVGAGFLLTAGVVVINGVSAQDYVVLAQILCCCTYQNNPVQIIGIASRAYMYALERGAQGLSIRYIPEQARQRRTTAQA